MITTLHLNADDIYNEIESAYGDGATELDLNIVVEYKNKKIKLQGAYLSGEIFTEYSKTIL